MWQIPWILGVCALTTCVAVEIEHFDELLSQSKLFSEFQKRIADLEERDSLQQQQIQTLTNELVEQTQENIFLRETVEDLKSLLDIKATSDKNSTQESHLRHVEPEQIIRQQANGIKRRINKVRSTQRRQINQADVAFSVGLSHSISHIGKNQNVVFDKVQTNIGNGYNSHQGIFIAPLAGTYVFFSSILTYNNGEVHCRFVVNNAHSFSMYARGSDGRHDQGSNMVIVQLNQGDDVAVQNMLADDTIYGDHDIYTTFSGFLLHGESGEAIIG